jgi:hypothetical protein
LGHRDTPSIDVSDEIAILAARPIASLWWREMDSNFRSLEGRTRATNALHRGYMPPMLNATNAGDRADKIPFCIRPAATPAQRDPPVATAGQTGEGYGTGRDWLSAGGLYDRQPARGEFWE